MEKIICQDLIDTVTYFTNNNFSKFETNFINLAKLVNLEKSFVIRNITRLSKLESDRPIPDIVPFITYESGNIVLSIGYKQENRNIDVMTNENLKVLYTTCLLVCIALALKSLANDFEFQKQSLVDQVNTAFKHISNVKELEVNNILRGQCGLFTEYNPYAIEQVINFIRLQFSKLNLR